MDIAVILILMVGVGGPCWAQILELPIQDKMPKMVVPHCPDTPYPIVLSTTGGLELFSNQYLVCFRALPLIFNCSDGLFFNPDRLTCEFPYERRSSPDQLIPDQDQEIPELPQYPVPINPDGRGGHGLYPITRPNPDVIPPVIVQKPPTQEIPVPYNPYRHL